MKIHSGWKKSTELTLHEFDGVLTSVNEDMRRLLVAKRESYGPFNPAKFGDDGCLIRTSDKIERLIHMRNQELDMTAVGESWIDAWRDIVGYGLLVLVAHELIPDEPDDQPTGRLTMTIESGPRHG